MKTVDMCLGQTKGEKQVTVLRILLFISVKNVKLVLSCHSSVEWLIDE